MSVTSQGPAIAQAIMSARQKAPATTSWWKRRSPQSVTGRPPRAGLELGDCWRTGMGESSADRSRGRHGGLPTIERVVALLPNSRHGPSIIRNPRSPGRMVASGKRATLGTRSLAAITTALLLFAAFPPLGWTALAFFAWIPLLFAQSEATPRVRRSLGGLMLGVLFGLIAATVNPPEVVTGIAWFGIAVSVGVLAGLAATALDVPVGPGAPHPRAGTVGVDLGSGHRVDRH